MRNIFLLPCLVFIALMCISHIILLTAPYEIVAQLGDQVKVKVYDYTTPVYQVCLRFLLPIGYIGASLSFLPILVVEVKENA